MHDTLAGLEPLNTTYPQSTIPSEIQRRRSTRSPLTAAQKSSDDEDEATHTLSICSSRPTQRSSDQAPPRRVRFSDDDEVDSVDRGLTGDFGDVD